MKTRKPAMPDRAARNRRTAFKLAVATLAMFGFGYALVPLYEVFCDITGLNGKTGVVEAKVAEAVPVDESRWVTVEFTGSVHQGMPWEFRPEQLRMRVRPGETAVAYYTARNRTNETIVGQAVPSVTPGRAGAHFKKIECFCFTQQTLKPGEERRMPVRFMVQPSLARDMRTVTLSYTFFNTDAQSARRFGGDAQDAPQAGHEHHDHGAHHAPGT
jgi:cytochrome c oxidase assembly protein subunit 11